MIFLRESIWWMMSTALVGFIIGCFKGMPRWGFLLGLLLGPIGCGVAIMLPSQRVRYRPGTQGAGIRDPFGPSGDYGSDVPASGCPRCRKPISGSDKACPHCGNVLVPVRYKVLNPPDPSGKD